VSDLPLSQYSERTLSEGGEIFYLEFQANCKDQCVPSHELPRARPQNPTRGHARTLPPLRDQNPPPPTHIRCPIPARQLDPAPRPQDLQPPDEQPRRAQNRRFRHGALLQRSAAAEAHAIGRYVVVSEPRTAAGSGEVWERGRHVECRMHIWRASVQGAVATRQKRS